jgi:cellulose 1,4-beta-cellobiosidase
MNHHFSSSRQRANACRLAFLIAALAAQAAFAQVQHVVNPYAGATVYVNPDYTNEVKAAIAAQPAGSTLATQMGVVGNYPTAVWMDHMAAIAGGSANSGRMGLAQHITAALAQQAASGTGKPIVVQIVIYDLPDRDCAALASNGEISIAANPPTQPLSGIDTYEQDFITPIANILAPYASNPNIRFVLVIEDDSLPNLITNTGESPNAAIANCVAANDGVTGSASLNGVYVQAIVYALNTFHAFPNVYQYLDVGHHGWLGWPNNFQAAVPFFYQVALQTTARAASIDGFITNTANYGPTQEPFMTATESIGGSPVNSATFYQFDTYIDEETYAAALDAALIAQGFPSTLGFLIDTSRNGWGGPNRPTGPSTSTVLNTFVDASKIDERDDMGQWCNQQNSGLGAPPTVNPGFFANLQAFVWIKPPGESDGNYPGSVYNGVTSTAGDPNCDPAHDNALANSMPTDALADSPSAGTFWVSEFQMLIQNADPPIPVVTGPGFTVSASSNAMSVLQGATGTASVTVQPFNGFTGTVSLTLTGAPANVTATLSPTSIAGSGGSTLTIVVGAAATPGVTALTVTGTGTSNGTTVTNSATINLTVVPAPNFTVTVSPASLTLPPNTNPTVTMTITSVGGFTGSISLSAGNLPTGVSANFSPSSVNGGGTSVVNFFAQSSTSAGTTNINLTGTSGALTHSAVLALTIPGATCSTVPSAPTVTATAASSSAITVSWGTVTPPTNCTITSYSVFRSTTSGFTPSSSNLVATVTSGTTFSNTGLTASTTYFYVVEAVDSDGTSAASAQASATTSPAVTCTAVPSAPTAFTATAASSSAINLSWTAVTPPTNCTITSYSVFRSTTSGFTPSSSNLVGTVTSGTAFSNTGLTASTTYFYVVEATDSDGTSAASAQASATTLPAATCTTVPSAPTTLTATAASSSAINLSWTAVTPPTNCTITSYSVFRSTATGFTPSSSNLVGTVTSGTTFSNTGLTASTTYFYVVEAVDANGTSAASAQASATTSPATGSCHVVYTISSQWPGGFGAAITINNTSSTALTNWTLTWAFANGQTVTQLWNGNETQSGANVTVTNMSYNGSIPAGGSYSGMGFNGSWNNTTNAVPMSFAINGTTCN